MRQPFMIALLCALLFLENAMIGRAAAEPTIPTSEIVSPSKDIVDCAPPVFDPDHAPSANAPLEKNKESVCLEKLKGFVFRSGNILKLRTDEGVQTLRDKEDDCGGDYCTTYKLIGYRPDQRIYIVRRTYSETEADVIIKLDHAKTEELVAPVLFSKDGKLALSVADSDRIMTPDYDIKILNLEDLTVIFNYYNHDVWRFVAWPTQTEIDLKTIEGNVSATPYTAKLIYSEGVWRLKMN